MKKDSGKSKRDATARRKADSPAMLGSESGYVPGIGCQCAALSESECGCVGVDWTPSEVYRLNAALGVAMVTLRQIASTPRNRGAKRNAAATV